MRSANNTSTWRLPLTVIPNPHRNMNPRIWYHPHLTVHRRVKLIYGINFFDITPTWKCLNIKWVQFDSSQSSSITCMLFTSHRALRDGFVRIYSLDIRVHYSTVVTRDFMNVENQLVSSFACTKLHDALRLKPKDQFAVKNWLDCDTFIWFLYASTPIVTFTHHNYTSFYLTCDHRT